MYLLGNVVRKVGDHIAAEPGPFGAGGRILDGTDINAGALLEGVHAKVAVAVICRSIFVLLEDPVARPQTGRHDDIGITEEVQGDKVHVGNKRERRNRFFEVLMHLRLVRI